MQQRIPTLSLIGCGGCGCNILKKVYAKLDDNIKASISTMVIDTAKSNFDGLSEDCKIHSIGELGSGRDRKKNAASIRLYFDRNPELGKNVSDISIIISSFGGGSGSNISPILTEHIMRRDSGKAVVIVGVLDTSSERDTINSITTLKTFEKFAKENGIAIPMLLFSNTMVINGKKAGKFGVDQSASTRIQQLINLLVGEGISELDWADRMAYLRPTDSGCDSGLCSISIAASSLDDIQDDLPGEMLIRIDTDTIVQGVLVVNESGLVPDIMSNVSYVGVSNKRYVSVMVEGVPPQLTQDLANMADKFKHAVKMKSTMTTDLDKFGEEDKTGLIL